MNLALSVDCFPSGRILQHILPPNGEELITYYSACTYGMHAVCSQGNTQLCVVMHVLVLGQHGLRQQVTGGPKSTHLLWFQFQLSNGLLYKCHGLLRPHCIIPCPHLQVSCNLDKLVHTYTSISCSMCALRPALYYVRSSDHFKLLAAGNVQYCIRSSTSNPELMSNRAPFYKNDRPSSKVPSLSTLFTPLRAPSHRVLPM